MGQGFVCFECGHCGLRAEEPAAGVAEKAPGRQRRADPKGSAALCESLRDGGSDGRSVGRRSAAEERHNGVRGLSGLRHLIDPGSAGSHPGVTPE